MEFEALLYFFFFFILGLFVGSFLCLTADRIIRDETFLKGRSYCEYCKHTLSFWDLFPVASFLFMGGKCRYCQKKLSWRYPFSEVTTGVVFVLTYMAIGISSFPQLLFYLFVVSALLVILLSDVQYGIIPDKIVYPLFLFILLFRVLTGEHMYATFFLSSLGSGVFFLLLFLLTKGKGMGFGDVKFSFVIGFLLGFPATVYALYIAFLTGAFVSLILILWRRKQIKSTIPFGPFLVVGTMIVLFSPESVETIVRMVLPSLN